jgi:starch synthase
VTLITQAMIDKYLDLEPMIEVLSVASELYPLIKTGGLADVTGRAPRSPWRKAALRMRTLVPGYPAVMQQADRRAGRLPRSATCSGCRAMLIAAARGGARPAHRHRRSGAL